MNISRLFKYATILIATVIVITFILPYNPEEIYSQTVVGTEKTLKEYEPPNQLNEPQKNKDNHEPNMGQPVDDPVRSSKKMYVILVTGFRTGSTFLGELFNQNADVLYLFEPFHQNHIKSLVKEGAIHGWFYAELFTS